MSSNNSNNIFSGPDTFRIDAKTGDIIGPAGSVVIARKDQMFPGMIVLDIASLNRLYRMGMLTVSAENLAQRAREQSRIEAAKAWIEDEEPLIEPPFAPAKKLEDPEDDE